MTLFFITNKKVMSISVKEAIKKRLQNTNSIILISPLIKKLKNWLGESDEELYTMKLAVNIKDINNQDFFIHITGECTFQNGLYSFQADKNIINLMEDIARINKIIDFENIIKQKIRVHENEFVKSGRVTGKLRINLLYSSSSTSFFGFDLIFDK